MYSAVSNQPALAAQAASMRQLAIAFGFCFVLISIGCNADPSCRRETALLRAEILDIEDKYAVLQSKYESTATELHHFNGQPIDQTMYGATSNYHNVILNEEIISNGEIITDHGSYPGYVESYPTGEVIYGNTIQSYPQGYPQGSGVIIEDPSLQLGTPYNGGFINESIGEGVLEENGTPLPTSPRNQNSLPLPNDTRNRRSIKTDELDVELPGLNRRSIPAIQASTTLGRKRGNRLNDVNVATRSAATEIVVNRSGTSGHDVDGARGDEGLNLLLQTKNSKGQIVLQGGELTVSLIDPKQRQRIGFWRFLASETELFFVDNDQNSDGILLHLPWDESVPERARLLVQVQFVTNDGRTLTTSSDVLIEPPSKNYSPDDPLVVNWTQSDSRWGDTGGGFVTTGVDSFDDLDDSFEIDNRQQAKDDWQENGTYKRGAKFSQLHDRDHSSDEDSSSGDANRISEAVDNPDQPKWRPVR